MRVRTIGLVVLVLAAAISLSGHVGSPDVYFEGDAGPYHLYVTVMVPQVIPGIAEIQVRSSSNVVEKIEIVPMRLSGAGSDFPPTPDVAERSKQDPQFFTGNLWLMEDGALKVRVTAEGSKGKGELAVPVPAFAQRTLPMERSLGGVLAVLMVFLAVGLVFIAGAAAREGNLAPGEAPTPARGRRAKIVMGITALAVVGIIFLGKTWWGAEARDYGRSVNYFKPPIAETSLENGKRLVIRARGQDPEWSENVKMKDVIPDHNHLMHLFLVRTPGMGQMLHLHPERLESGDFVEDLPNVAAGQYEVFADIVDKHGFPWTLVGQVELPQISGRALEGDDSVWSGQALTGSASGSRTAQLADGGRLVWERGSEPLKANTAMTLRFKIEDKDGQPAKDVEPYMGMAGHAEIVSSDLSVFAHIHPAGSVSMAALDLANGVASGKEGITEQPAMPTVMQMAGGLMQPEVSFPYGFPKAGEYRIFVQIRRAGNVETGVFDARVQ